MHCSKLSQLQKHFSYYSFRVKEKFKGYPWTDRFSQNPISEMASNEIVHTWPIIMCRPTYSWFHSQEINNYENWHRKWKFPSNLMAIKLINNQPLNAFVQGLVSTYYLPAWVNRLLNNNMLVKCPSPLKWLSGMMMMMHFSGTYMTSAEVLDIGSCPLLK